MNLTAKILVAKNKQTNEILFSRILGDEDSSDCFTCLRYPCTLFTLQQLQESLDGWSQSTQQWAVDMYEQKADFLLEAEAWDLPSIGDFEVTIISKQLTID